MHVHVYACTLAVGSAPLNTLVLWSSYHRDIKLFGALFSPVPRPPPSSFLALYQSFFFFFFLTIPQRYRLATPINILRTNFHALNNDRFRILTKAINNCDDTSKVRLPFFFLPLYQFSLSSLFLCIFYMQAVSYYLCIISMYKYIII